MKSKFPISRILCRLLLSLGMLVASLQMAIGQNVFLDRGNKAFEEMAYPEAIFNYEKGLISKFDKQAMLNLADAYRLTNNNEKALESYSKLVKINQIPALTYFYFAQCLLKVGKYEDAIAWLERYLKAEPNDVRASNFLKSTKEIEKLYQDSADIRLLPFAFNSKQDDFSPIWYEDGILFSSSRGNGDVLDMKYEWNDQPFLDIYYSRIKANKAVFAAPKLLRGELNTRFHEGTCSWDSLRHVAYFTRNNFSNGKKISDANGIMNLTVFSAEINAFGHLENETALPFNDRAYSCGHPAVVPNENALIFASDMPGGYGGTDLYYVLKTENGWDKPKNLGAAINTAGNENFPFVGADNMLYFSSDGLGGLGGLDIFKTMLDFDNFVPLNLGSPINSTDDDFGFLPAKDHLWGMFSSNRPSGSGGDDLYIFEYQKPLWTAIVVDAETKLPIVGANVELIAYDESDAQEGLTFLEGEAKFVLNSQKKYHVAASATQYRAKTIEISTVGQAVGSTKSDTIFLDRPAVHVITTVLDPATGYPVIDAKVKVVGSDISYQSNEKGEVDFYYDPYPDYQNKPLDCQPIQEGDYCFIFSDEGFFDFDTLQLVYDWDFGDGQHARGIEVRHCYAKPGIYHVALNLLEPSGAIFLNQSRYDLEVRPNEGLQIAVPDTVTRGKPVILDASASTLSDCEIQSFQWTIGDDVHYSGNKVSHVFRTAGRYRIQLEAGGIGAAPLACGTCGSKEIVVLDAGWQSNKADSLEEAWTDMNSPAPDFKAAPCAPQAKEDYCYKFEDDGGLLGDTLPFSYIWDFGDGEKRMGETLRHCYESPGNYPVKLIVQDPLTGQQISVLSEYDLEVKDLHQVYIESPDTVALGETFKLHGLKTDIEGCVIDKVWWEFGDNESDPGPVVFYQYFNEGSYQVKLLASGTTSDGKSPCSQCSSKEIVVKKGYLPSRDNADFGKSVKEMQESPFPNGTVLLEIEKEGYETQRVSFTPGTTSPTRETVSLKVETPRSVPKFEAAPTESKSADGQTNIKVQVNVSAQNQKGQLEDVKIVLQDALTGESLAAYSLPNDGKIYLPLEFDHPYHVLVQREGYLSEKLSLGPLSKEKPKAEVSIALRKIQIGDTWVLNNLYYDYGKSFIRHDAAIELLKLAAFLKENPDLKIELSSHTDARGSDEFNYKLSVDRANAAIVFLKSRGIPARQIVAQGYGEQKLVNKCSNGVNCSEAQHQANRRTEIKILGYGGTLEETPSLPEVKIPSSPPQGEPLKENPTESQNISGNFTILLGTYTSKQLPARFAVLKEGQKDVREVSQGGFFRYYYSTFENEAETREKLAEIRLLGFKNSSLIRLDKN